MAPKRKSDAAELSDDGDFEVAATTSTAKKPRLSDKENATKATKGKGKAAAEKRSWTDITLDGEDDGDLPVFDDCNEVRRKIRLLQKEPDFKVTQWLKQIGGINSNSFQRFMKASGPQGGAENGTYKAAYIYFEKVRIAEGKKKTAKRERNETEQPGGLSMRSSHRGYWGPA
ncbi:hypothetical protein BDZ89DRAFT_1055935 [Hymenopellis radicata]|nr:hypothetical protein BDZ89DRAFT_1055935 [Hymenopellis radicata]